MKTRPEDDLRKNFPFLNMRGNNKRQLLIFLKHNIPKWSDTL